MQNPFESGHIKNYILLYVSVVVIMILFFIATTLFHDVKSVDKKVFNTTVKEKNSSEKEDTKPSKKFKLMEKAY